MQSEDERELNCFYMQDPARCLTGRMSYHLGISYALLLQTVQRLLTPLFIYQKI
jgi:hypothetical protein